MKKRREKCYEYLREKKVKGRENKEKRKNKQIQTIGCLDDPEDRSALINLAASSMLMRHSIT